MAVSKRNTATSHAQEPPLTIARVALHARGVGQVRAGAALNLREVALADGFAEVLLDHAGEFHLRQFTVEAADGALHFAEVSKFFTERHCNL